jgi:hypothetical protein
MKHPAKHSRDARNDQIAVSRITDWITSSGYAVPNIESYDTWPNYDGPIDLIDDQGYIRGTLFVQVKKLPEQHNLRYSFNDEGKFLAYCRELASWIPILFIGIDLTENCAYWLHMSEALLNQLADSQTIHFEAEQSFSASNLASIRSWHTIAARYADIARERNALEAQVNALQQQIESSLIGTDKSEFTKLHLFLDEYNRFLDHDLSIIKKVYYPNAWKLGIAYAKYSSDALSYFLYPIKSTVNDVAIKKLNPDTFKPLLPAPPSSTWHIGNPLEQNPRDYAKGLIKKRIDTILKYKLLDHTGVVTLAREYLFAYIDKYTPQLGLSKKDSYTIKDLEEAFFNYHPRWLFTARKVLAAHRNAADKGRTLDATASDTVPYDPNHFAFLGDPILQEIQQQVASQMAAKTTAPVLAVTGDKLSPAIFASMLNFVKQKGMKKVVRLYKPKDPAYLESTKSNYSWDLYSPVARLYNTKRATTRLQATYNKIISNNFPEISRQLTFIEPGHRLIYVYDSAENVGGPKPPPGAKAYEIVADKIHAQNRPTFLLADEHTIDTKVSNSKWLLIIDGEEHELVSISGTGVDIWLSDTPLFDMVYERLKKALDEHLKL